MRATPLLSQRELKMDFFDKSFPRNINLAALILEDTENIRTDHAFGSGFGRGICQQNSNAMTKGLMDPHTSRNGIEMQILNPV
jgi:hypothetical protein